MTTARSIVVVLLAIAAFAVISLAIGAGYLETMLPGGLPLGNALTAIGLCAVAGAAVGLSTRGTVLYSAALVSLLAAAMWLPASIALAGNLTLNFGGGRGAAWVVFSMVVIVGAFSTLLWALVASAIAIRRRASAP